MPHSQPLTSSKAKDNIHTITGSTTLKDCFTISISRGTARKYTMTEPLASNWRQPEPALSDISRNRDLQSRPQDVEIPTSSSESSMPRSNARFDSAPAVTETTVPPDSAPTDCHALAAQDHEVKGATQVAHGESEVKDLGWDEDAKHIPAPLVGGLPNEELWTLVRRFNKVSCQTAPLRGLATVPREGDRQGGTWRS